MRLPQTVFIGLAVPLIVASLAITIRADPVALPSIISLSKPQSGGMEIRFHGTTGPFRIEVRNSLGHSDPWSDIPGATVTEVHPGVFLGLIPQGFEDCAFYRVVSDAETLAGLTPPAVLIYEGQDGHLESVNIIALHDRSSRQFKKNCTECHDNILQDRTLDPAIQEFAIHGAMLPFAPGKVGKDQQCVVCHQTVDLAQGVAQPREKSNGNLRKHVDSALCALCHGPSGPGRQLYQVGLASLHLDGESLYELTCAGCHGVLANSKVRGESASNIRKKIAENEAGMGPLSALSSEQVESIAATLAQQETHEEQD